MIQLKLQLWIQREANVYYRYVATALTQKDLLVYVLSFTFRSDFRNHTEKKFFLFYGFEMKYNICDPFNGPFPFYTNF